jgi:hypothetical protein
LAELEERKVSGDGVFISPREGGGSAVCYGRLVG